MHFGIQLFAWLVFDLILMSFIEHHVHRHMMHRKHILSGFIPALARVFNSHAVKHHATYAKVFSDEPVGPNEDKGIRLNLLEGFFESLPFAAIIAFFSIPGAIMFIGVALMHHYVWNQIHLEMHKPVHKSFSRWPVYQFLARHHALHHKYPERNFNVVLPIADYLLGTNIRSTRAEAEAVLNAHLVRETVRR